MKKTYALLIVALFLMVMPLEVYPLDFKWHFGAKVGAGFSDAFVENHTASTSSGLFSRPSFAGGIFTSVSHVDFVRLQLEFLYLKKGFKRNGYSANLDYLSIPILARYQFDFGLFLTLGVGITFIIDGTVFDSSSSNTSYKDYYDDLEYDVQGGFGWEIGVFKGGSILLEYRLTYALNNISTRFPETFHFFTNHVYVGFQY